MMKKLLLIFLLLYPTLGLALPEGFKEGNLTLAELIKSCPEIAHSTPSHFVSKDIPGKIINIKGVPYEVRYFSYEDPTGKILAPNKTFKDFVKENKLDSMKSILSEPLPGIQFQSFDFRRSPTTKKIYFSMALKICIPTNGS